MDFSIMAQHIVVEFSGITYTFGHFFKGFQNTPLHDSLFLLYKPNNNRGPSGVLMFLDIEKGAWENQSIEVGIGELKETYSIPVEVLREVVQKSYELYQKSYTEALLLRTQKKVSNGEFKNIELNKIALFLEGYL